MAAALPIPVGAQDAPANDGAAASAVLRPGDVVRVAVWKRPEFTGDFAVAPDGSVLHPVFREIHVAGEPFSVVEQRFRVLLQRYDANPQFVVEPLINVVVGGQVLRPSLLTVPLRTTVAEALALAGGTADRADLTRVRLIRAGQERVGDLQQPGAGLAQEPLQSRDQIYVPRRRAIFTDYVLPSASLTAAVISVVSLFLRRR